MDRDIVHSPLNYTGGKARILPFLLPLFPQDIECFYDLFCGGLNVSLNVETRRVVANDISTRTVDIYRTISSFDSFVALDGEIRDIIRRFGLHDGMDCNAGNVSRDGYERLRDSYNTTGDPLELLVLLFYSFSNHLRFNKQYRFNVPVGKSYYNSKNKVELEEMHRILRSRRFEFSSKSFSDFPIESFGVNDFVYCDPPYLITTATYNERHNEESGWGEQEERELYAFLDHLNERGVRFGLSNVVRNNGRTNMILHDWMGKYSVFHPDIRYSNANYHRHRKSKENDTEEVYVTNCKDVAYTRGKQLNLF